MAVHFFPAAFFLLQVVCLLADVIPPHSRVVGITGKLTISLPRLPKWSLMWFFFLNHVCYIKVWSCQIKWHLKVSQGEPEKSLWNTSLSEVLTAWTHMNSAQMQLDFIREFPIRRKYLICSSDVTLNYNFLLIICMWEQGLSPQGFRYLWRPEEVLNPWS